MPIELQYLGRAVKQAQYRHHRELDRALAGIGTTLAQWDALRAIDRVPASSAHDLAVRTFQSDQAFGTLAARLIAQGLVVREQAKGRRIEHRLTESGEAMLAAGHPLADAMLERSFEGFSEDEKATLLALLTRVGND